MKKLFLALLCIFCFNPVLLSYTTDGGGGGSAPSHESPASGPEEVPAQNPALPLIQQLNLTAAQEAMIEQWGAQWPLLIAETAGTLGVSLDAAQGILTNSPLIGPIIEHGSSDDDDEAEQWFPGSTTTELS